MLGFLHFAAYSRDDQHRKAIVMSKLLDQAWRKLSQLGIIDQETIIDSSGKLLVFFGIALSGREFVAGIATAIFGQIAVSLNDRPQTIGEAIKRLVGTILCAFFAAMACGLPIVKSFPPVIVMGMAGALSMTIIKILDAFKRKADSKADQAADKILDNVKDRFGG